MQGLEGRLEAAGEERQQLGELQEGLLQEQEQLQAAMDLQQQAHRSTEVGPPPVPAAASPSSMQEMCKGCCLWGHGSAAAGLCASVIVTCSLACKVQQVRAPSPALVPQVCSRFAEPFLSGTNGENLQGDGQSPWMYNPLQSANARAPCACLAAACGL